MVPKMAACSLPDAPWYLMAPAAFCASMIAIMTALQQRSEFFMLHVGPYQDQGTGGTPLTSGAGL